SKTAFCGEGYELPVQLALDTSVTPQHNSKSYIELWEASMVTANIKQIARFCTPPGLRNWLRSPTRSAMRVWDEIADPIWGRASWGIGWQPSVSRRFRPSPLRSASRTRVTNTEQLS